MLGLTRAAFYFGILLYFIIQVIVLQKGAYDVDMPKGEAAIVLLNVRSPLLHGLRVFILLTPHLLIRIMQS